jgi:hypothetical protein
VTKRAARGETEREIKHAIRVALGRLPDVALWNNAVAVVTLDSGRTMPVGLGKGSSDLIGIGPGGRFLALEVKTATGRVTADQRRFIELVRKLGGISAAVRSPAEALAVIESARFEWQTLCDMTSAITPHAPVTPLRRPVDPATLPRPKRARGRARRV